MRVRGTKNGTTNQLCVDFVIVGAGAAGCVLANRLSASGRHSVALIEAGGPDRHAAIRVPALVGMLIGNRELDWGYSTEPQLHSKGRRIPLPRGRVLGGCTSINGMVYFRGHPADYDEWRDLGCAGWGYEDVLPYFVRAEDNANFSGDAHGQRGPVHVSSYGRANPLTGRFVQAAHELGFGIVEDFNSGSPEGFGLRQAMIRRGRRVSGVTAFLGPAARRRNLIVLSGRLADRVLFERGKASEIVLARDGRTERVRARAGIILSAGSFGSPTILERSGIGDGPKLAACGIAPLHHAPEVGKNLQDHVVAPVQMLTRSAAPYVVDFRALPRLIANVAEYALLRRGPLASNVFEAAGFVRSSLAGERPDLQLIFMPAHRAAGPLPRKRGFGALVGLLRPQSRGSVHIASAAPHVPPRIDPAFLSAEADMPPLVEGVRLARRLFARRAFAGINAHELLPGDACNSDDEIAETIRETCVTVHHPVGTCRMGPDPRSVTDCTLRVRGVDGLWVADASIMPRLIGGNTAAPAYMIAEKASEIVLRGGA